jgi:hypothetical protein
MGARRLLGDDLRESSPMLGDTGANVIGAALGLAVVLGTNSVVRLVIMLVLLAANVAAERISFSAVIDSVGFLRAIDRLGRVRVPPPQPGGGRAQDSGPQSPLR